MDYATLSILFLLLALGLLIAEFFVPSGGFLALLTLIALVVSVWAAWKAWWDTPFMFWGYIAFLVVLLPTVIGTIVYLLPRTNFGRRVILAAPKPEEVVLTEEHERLEEYIGQRGLTQSLMAPGGIVLVEGERLHAESDGTMIEPNVEVEVIAVKINRIVVRVPREAAETNDNDDNENQATPTDSEQTAWEEEERNLDFEL